MTYVGSSSEGESASLPGTDMELGPPIVNSKKRGTRHTLFTDTEHHRFSKRKVLQLSLDDSTGRWRTIVSDRPRLGKFGGKFVSLLLFEIFNVN